MNRGRDLLARLLEGGRQIPFACLGSDCPNTCCGPFHGTRAVRSVFSVSDLGESLDGSDAVSENVSIFAQIRLTPEDVSRLRAAGLDHLMVYRGDPGDPDYYLRLLPDGSCASLGEDKLCGIHPHRPTICRAFPFYFDLFAGLCMVEECPGLDAELQPAEALRDEVEAAAKMYEFWIRDILA